MSNQITWRTKAFGRESDLKRLHKGMNDHRLGPLTRRGHDRAHTKITTQLRDPVYCRLREQLLKATRAGDQKLIARLELRIRDHLHEPREAFSNHKDY